MAHFALQASSKIDFSRNDHSVEITGFFYYSDFCETNFKDFRGAKLPFYTFRGSEFRFFRISAIFEG